MTGSESDVSPLIARWDAFLAKIEATFHETLEDAEPALLELILDEGGGVIPFLESVSAIKTQIQNLTSRIDPTWREKVRPLLQEADPEQEHWDELELSIRGSKVEEGSSVVLERWVTVVSGKAAERLHERTMAEARTLFRCTLCSADMEITENLFRAHYEVCPYCSGRNTYEPSTELRETRYFTADHLARYRVIELKDALDAAHARCSEERSPVPDEPIEALRSAHLAYYTAYLRERIQILPDHEATYDKDLARYVREFETTRALLKGEPIRLPKY